MAVLQSRTPESSYYHQVLHSFKLMLKGIGVNYIVYWVVDTCIPHYVYETLGAC